jgi:hypothetical protein
MMFLTELEVLELTDRKMPSKQREWLNQHGWQFVVGASGRPKVSRAYAEDRLGGVTHKASAPDFSAFQKTG